MPDPPRTFRIWAHVNLCESRAAKTASTAWAAFCVTTTSAGELLRFVMPATSTAAAPMMPVVSTPIETIVSTIEKPFSLEICIATPLSNRCRPIDTHARGPWIP